MISQSEDKTLPKYSIEIKQKEDGEFYLASFKLNSDSDEDLFDSLNLCMEGINRTLGRLNSARVQTAPKAGETIAQKPASVQKPKEKTPKKPAEEIFRLVLCLLKAITIKVPVQVQVVLN